MKTDVIMYLATRGEYSDYRILGVFSTREKARARLDNDIKEHQGYDYCCEVTEVVLDNDETIPGHYVSSSVCMVRDGEVLYVSCGGTMTDARRGNWAAKDSRTFYMMAKTPEHAVKVANERRTKMIAENQW